jgi:hypothetical protein
MSLTLFSDLKKVAIKLNQIMRIYTVYYTRSRARHIQAPYPFIPPNRQL